MAVQHWDVFLLTKTFVSYFQWAYDSEEQPQCSLTSPGFRMPSSFRTGLQLQYSIFVHQSMTTLYSSFGAVSNFTQQLGLRSFGD